MDPLHSVVLQGTQKPNKCLFHKLQRNLEARIPTTACWWGRLESAYFGHKGSKRKKAWSTYQVRVTAVGQTWGEVTVSQAPGRLEERRLGERGAPFICNLSSLEVNEEEQELCVIRGHTASLRPVCVTRDRLANKTNVKLNGEGHFEGRF